MNLPIRRLLSLNTCLLVGILSSSAIPRLPTLQTDETKTANAGAADHGVYEPWDGAWEGEFRIVRASGETETLKVRHTYRSESPTRQWVNMLDEYPDGHRVQKTAENLVQNGKLLCRVYRRDGSLEVEHDGRLVDDELVWSSRDDRGRIRQIFRERIEDDLYSIDGVGIYGPERDVVELYVGRYRRVAE